MVHRLLELFTDHQVGAASHALLLEAPQPERQNSLFLLFSRFSPDLLNSAVFPGLKARLDLSAEYLILTDVQRKVRADPPPPPGPLYCLPGTVRLTLSPLPLVPRQVLYVMELRQDLDGGKATFTAVSQFLMTHPVLSFGVREVTYSRLQNTELLPPEEDSESLSTGLPIRPVTPTLMWFFFSVSECPRPSFKVNLLFPFLSEGNQGPPESKTGILIKLYCVHTK